MKRKLVPLVFTVFVAGILFANCQSSATKVENAKDKVHDAEVKVAEANQDLNLALKDSIQQFKSKSERLIIANENRVAEIKAAIAIEKKENKEKYEKKLAELEKKNSDLKKKLAEFQDEEQTKWEKFKTEFNHDMDELGEAFKDLTINNKK